MATIYMKMQDLLHNKETNIPTKEDFSHEKALIYGVVQCLTGIAFLGAWSGVRGESRLGLPVWMWGVVRVVVSYRRNRRSRCIKT